MGCWWFDTSLVFEKTLVTGAVSSEAVRVTSSDLTEHLAGLEAELDVDNGWY